jgi:stress-induced morphogen
MTGLAWRAAQIPAQIEQAFTDAIDPETGEIVNESALERVNALAHEKTVAIEDLAYFVKELQTVKIAHLDAII